VGLETTPAAGVAASEWLTPGEPCASFVMLGARSTIDNESRHSTGGRRSTVDSLCDSDGAANSFTAMRYPKAACGTAIAATLAMFACAGHSMPGMESMSGAYDSQVADGVTRLRAMTNAFHSLDSAVAAGYARDVADCIVHEQHGAMGFHHVNRAYVDAKLEIERPEILLYERKPDGKYQLNGVEFILPYRFYSRDSVPPVLMGQKLTQEDNLKYWYLHVWAWTNNVDGLFSTFNPKVSCPAGTAKLYKPSNEP